MSDFSATLFNATVASSAISGAFELGLFHALNEKKEGVPVSQFCKDNHLDPASFYSMIYALSCFDIVRQDRDLLQKGARFDEIDRDKGYFHWMIKGYADFLANFSSLMDQRLRKGSFYRRNGKAIAQAGKDYGTAHVDSSVLDLLRSLSFHKIADLGCGSAHRILEIRREIGCKAVGIEIDSGGVALARELVQKANSEDSIQIVQGDVSQLSALEEFKDIDLISSFFMGHDLWPKERCIQIFSHFLKVFPNVRYFLFCDTYQAQLPPQQTVPTFTLGFEVFHALMGQYIPTIAEWESLFPLAGWECVQKIITGIPYTSIFLLKPK